MPNTYVNKVQTADGTALIDLTSDTAVASNVVSGKYFHLATGERVQGSIATRTSSDLTASGATVTVPAGYYASDASKAVANGTVTAPSSINEINATKIINATTISLSKTVSVTPVVSTAGYVSSGTAGNVNVSLQAALTTKSTESYHPSTSDQTISSGTYLTGLQTIKGVTVSGLSASNIKKDVVVKIGDSTDDDCVTSVTGTYEGGGNEFVVTVSYNSTTQMWEPDRTISEIVTASQTGMNISVNADATPATATADGSYDSRDHILIYCVREFNDSSLDSIIEQYYQLDEDNGLTKTGEETYIIPSGSTTITQNGNNIDVTELSSINVAVSGGGVVITDTTDSAGGTIRTITAEAVTLQSKTNISPTTSSQTIEPDTGYTGLSSVQINAMPTMTLPTSAAASATSGYSSKATISRSTSDQYINIPTGYNSAGAYYKVNAVANGSATAPATITGSSATVSTGTNTLTLTKTVSVTPSVTAGYVSSGTAGNSDVSLTASVTTQAAQTIHPSTSDQTISSGRYLTGTQTVKAVTLSNLTAENIKSGVVVKVGDSTDDDCVTSVTGTYSGGGGSSKNVQTVQSTSRRNNTALGSITSLTCSTAGTYDVYWTCARSNTSQTWGSQLYIGGSAYDSENTTWSNNVQNNHLENVSISANQTVAVYGRSRSGYYIYAPQLTIVQK